MKSTLRPSRRKDMHGREKGYRFDSARFLVDGRLPAPAP